MTKINKSKIEGISPMLWVFDMPTSLRFYRDKLEFTLEASSGEGDDVSWVMLKLNNILLMLNTIYEKHDRPPNPDDNRIKGHEDITLYFNYPDIDAFYRYMNSKGLNLKEPAISGYGWKVLSFKDPDGFNLCFHWPNEI